ncbi:MAG: DoxX family protein [Chitinophagaceae bacterium]
MINLKSSGRIIFATGIAGLGVICFVAKDFIVGRPPAWPGGMNVNPALAYISGALLIISSIAICVKRKAAQAALLVAILIFLLSILRHLPHFMNDWLNAYKAMALFGGALIVAASLLNRDSGLGNKKTAHGLILIGSVLLAIFFISAGYAHFKFAAFVADFIPSYIPFRTFWAYACGVCLLAGGAGLLIPPVRKWAALLMAIMLTGWFLLLHIPRFATNINDASDRMGLCESFTFSGICFVLAAMFGKMRSVIS